MLCLKEYYQRHRSSCINFFLILTYSNEKTHTRGQADHASRKKRNIQHFNKLHFRIICLLAFWQHIYENVQIGHILEQVNWQVEYKELFGNGVFISYLNLITYLNQICRLILSILNYFVSYFYITIQKLNDFSC